jgi:transcriptional regulator with XRE-family HTH domain
MENTFTNWLNMKFLDWQRDQQKRQTLVQFAEFVGVPQPMMSAWVNGRYQPGRKYLPILAEALGDEIYDVMGMSRPSTDELEPLSDDFKARLKIALKELGEQMAASNLDRNDPDAIKLTMQVFKKHNITFTE